MKHYRFTVSTLALTTLCACGGGGSGGVSSSGSVAPAATPAPAPTPTPAPTPAPPADHAAPVAPPQGSIITPATMQPTRSINDTAEFRQNYAANELVNALYAPDNGWTGQGVTVGVLDDGVSTTLPALQGRISELSKDFGYETTNGVTTSRNRLGDDKSDHGTAIASIIAARRDGAGTVGIAPDAKIAVLRTSDYNHDTSSESLRHDADALDYAGQSGIKVVNRSLASQGFNSSLRDAVGRLGASGGLLINAAGNSRGDAPIDAVNVDAVNRDAWLFVVALDPSVQSSHTLASYSNRAGVMADRTVTASGTSYTTKVDGSVATFSGTSSAAAQVSGLAALILDKWPQLSGGEAGKVILNTARDIGEPGVDATFGHGLIDIKAALAPVNPTISNGAAQTALAGSVMALPEAVSAGSMQTALSSITLLDQYGRDYTGSIADLVVKPDTRSGQPLRRRLAQVANGGVTALVQGPLSANLSYASVRVGMAEGDAYGAITSGAIAYQAGRTSVRLGFNAQNSVQDDIVGLAPYANGVLAYAPQAGNSLELSRATSLGRVGVTLAKGTIGRARAKATTLAFDIGRTALRATWIKEKGAVLGAVSQGGLSLGRGSTTALMEAHRTIELSGGWSLEGYGSVGVTRLKIDSMSVVTGATTLVGTRAGVQASRPIFGGVLSLGIAQPLTIESGRAHLTLGSGYDLASRSLLHRSTSASLASDARRLQWTAGFVRGDERSSLRLGVAHQLSDGSLQALAGYRFRF